MFNVTVINVKQSIKNITILLLILLVLFIASKIIPKIQKSKILQINLSDKIKTAINDEIPAIENTNNKSKIIIKEETEEEKKESIIGKILSVELATIDEKNIDTKILDENNVETEINAAEENKNENVQNEENRIDVKTEEAENNLTIEVVTKNPITQSYNIELNGVKIKNETAFDINETIFTKKLEIDKKNVLIFHTHTCESYKPTELYAYEQTGNYRTTDLNFTVAKVGDELEKNLLEKGFTVTHNKTYHDYPAYTGSYNRSRETVENILKTNKSDIIIDIHRDAIGSKNDYDPSVKIGEETVSQLMFVIGTNGGGLYHPDWQSNLKFAIEVQQKANEIYPGLFKPIIVRSSRYNQHLGKAACIIEVGATGNTLEQSMASMKYLAKVLEQL